MVLIRQIEANRGLDVGSAPNVQIDNGVAEGIQQVAQGLGGAAQNARNHELRLAEREASMAEFQADQSFTRLGTQFAANVADRQTNIDPTGAGFTAGVRGDFNKSYDEFLGSIPAPLRPKFEELALTEREKWITSAAATENDQRNKYVVQGITDTVSDKQSEVFNNPGGYASALSDVTRLIDTAPDMTPVQRNEAKKAAAQALSQSWAERMQQDDPAALVEATGLSSREGYYSAIRAAESGGNDNAQNPNSSASGRYQFTTGTWNDLVARHPNSGLTVAGKNDPAQQETAIRLFTAENANALTSAGIPQTNGNLYAAHFLGAGDAVRVLGAAGNSLVSSIVPQGVVDANPFLKGMTVAAFKTWAAGKGTGDGSAGEVAPELASLDFASRMKVHDQAQAQVQTNVTQANAAAKAQYDATKGSLQLGIVNGEVASEQSILEAGLSDSDTAGLIRSFRTAQGDKQNLLQAVSQFQQGSLAVDPYSTDDRKVVDGIFDTINKAAAPEQQPFAVNELIRQAGVVPTPLQNQMRVGVASADPGVMLPALQQAQAIDDMGGGILGRRDGGADIQAKADLFSVYTRDMGYTPEQAAQRIAATNDPEQVKAREALLKSKPVTDMLKAVTPNDVAGIFGWNTAVGENPAQSAAMVSEYKSLLEESLVDANGDQSAAKELAATKFQRIYGKSDLTLAGGGVVTRLPPEKTYPPLPDGSFGYIKTQLLDALNAAPESSAVVKGNIDITARPRVVNADGSISTVRSMSFEEDGMEVLVPTVSDDGKILSDDEAIALYQQTGRHLGKFNSADEADAYAEGLHEQQAVTQGGVITDARLVAYDGTSADFDHGQPARYQVSYLQNGQWQLFNLPFVADYQAAIAGFNGDRTKQVEDARRRQQQNAGAVIENDQGQPANGQEMTNQLMQQLYGGANAVSP